VLALISLRPGGLTGRRRGRSLPAMSRAHETVDIFVFIVRAWAR
jgi:hypothetical protein